MLGHALCLLLLPRCLPPSLAGWLALSGTPALRGMLTPLQSPPSYLSTFTITRRQETVGDAYMVCGNIRENGQSADHCARVARFALEAVRRANGVAVHPGDPSLGSINIRAGFHCGPAVASVVGRATPRFCLFGDTVNQASRMGAQDLPFLAVPFPPAGG